MPSGVFQLKVDDEKYIGHTLSDNDQVEVIVNTSGCRAIRLRLNSLDGSGYDGYTLQDNINMFKAGYLDPLGIEVIAGTCSTTTDPGGDHQLFVEFAKGTNEDVFEVTFSRINTPGRFVNLARIMRAIWNGNRDNTNIVRAVLKALDPTRDTTVAEPWPQDGVNDPNYASTSGAQGVSVIADASLAPGGTVPTGNILLVTVGTDEHLEVRFSPIFNGGIMANATVFADLLYEKILNTLQLGIENFLWLNIQSHTSPDYYSVRFNIGNDPVKAILAFRIIEAAKSGIYNYYETLREAVFRDICDIVEPS